MPCEKKIEKKYQISGMEISSQSVLFRVGVGCQQHHHEGECRHMLKRFKKCYQMALTPSKSDEAQPCAKFS